MSRETEGESVIKGVDYNTQTCIRCGHKWYSHDPCCERPTFAKALNAMDVLGFLESEFQDDTEFGQRVRVAMKRGFYLPQGRA